MYDEVIPHEADHYETMNEIIEHYLKGNKNPTAIAKLVGLPRKDVLLYIEEWQALAQNSDYAKGRAEEALVALDKHFDMIIAEQWNIVHDGGTDNRTRATVLKNLADVEAKRQEVIQKSGLYDDAGITDELVLQQERADKMKQALITVVKENPHLKTRVLSLLSAIEDEIVVVPEDKPLEGEVVKT